MQRMRWMRWALAGTALWLGGCQGGGPEMEPGPDGGSNVPAQGSPDAGSPESSASIPGKVTGVVLDSQGHPIPNALVRIESGISDYHFYDVHTDANGRYVSPPLGAGGYRAVAWAQVRYQDLDYVLRLGMPDPSGYELFTADDGAVRNFRWQISGRIPDRAADGSSGYFGGALAFNDGTGSIYEARLEPGDVVEVMLEPDGPLIDGSTGETLQRSFTIAYGNESYWVTDIPTGTYLLSATCVTPEGAREELWVGSFSEQWKQARVFFLPSGHAWTYESGLSSTSVFLRR